jgi:hypothetical protein
VLLVLFRAEEVEFGALLLQLPQEGFGQGFDFGGSGAAQEEDLCGGGLRVGGGGRGEVPGWV